MLPWQYWYILLNVLYKFSFFHKFYSSLHPWMLANHLGFSYVQEFTYSPCIYFRAINLMLSTNIILYCMAFPFFWFSIKLGNVINLLVFPSRHLNWPLNSSANFSIVKWYAYMTWIFINDIHIPIVEDCRNLFWCLISNITDVLMWLLCIYMYNDNECGLLISSNPLPLFILFHNERKVQGISILIVFQYIFNFIR